MNSVYAASAMMTLVVFGLPPAVAESSLIERLGGLSPERDTFDDRFFGCRDCQWVPPAGEAVASQWLRGEWSGGVPLPRYDPRFYGLEPWKFNSSLSAARYDAMVAGLCLNVLMPTNSQDIDKCGI